MAVPGMTPFELAIVIEVFGLERPELNVPGWYSLEVFTLRPGPLPAVSGLRLDVAAGLEAVLKADTVIVPGWPPVRPVPPDVIDALRGAHERGTRIVSICSGAFALAAAGLLDGRRAATHWQYADRLARAYPKVRVDPDVLFVDDGDVLTAAGSAAGIDVCVHLIRTDHGASVANHVARRLVVPPIRDGGQAQYVEAPVATVDDDRIHDVIAWLSADLARPVTVPMMAVRTHLSERQFTRRFRAVTGSSPMDWLVGQRLQASLALLEAGDDPIARVGASVGFPNAVIFRKHFRTRMRTTPTAYRRAFRLGSSDLSVSEEASDAALPA
jgi:AraC family transcriptional activator FtrA